MKKKLINLVYTALFAVLLLAFGSNLCKAQTSYCDVPQDPLWNGCVCTENSSDRIDIQSFDDGINNIELNWFQYSRTGSSYKYDGDPTSAIKYAIAYLLTKLNPIGGSGCIDVTLHIPNCWKVTYNNNGTVWNTVLTSCNNGCCTYVYRICFGVNPMTATLQSYIASVEKCSGDCNINVCGNSQYFPNTISYDTYNNTMTVDGLPIPIGRIGSRTEGQVQNTASLSVFPNPNDGKVQITLSSSDKGNLTFKVFNATGICLKTLNYEKGTSELSFNVDFSSLVNGVYYIKAYNNDNQIGESSFVISR